MTRERDFERATTAWLEAGTDSTPPQLIDAVLLAVRTTPQERDRRVPWRLPSMKNSLFAAASVAVILLAGLVAIYGIGSPGAVDQPTASLTPTPTVTARPTPRATPVPTPIDTAAWQTYRSAQYGFTVGYPPDWSAMPADHAWNWAQDRRDLAGRGTESFRDAADTIRVSVWPITLDPGQRIDSLEDIEAWAGNFCQQWNEASVCTNIQDRAVPMCLQPPECHPALLVTFAFSTQAFFSGGPYDSDTMMVASVWWADDAPATRRWGGSIRLLEAFLSTMQVCPTPDSTEPRSPGCQR